MTSINDLYGSYPFLKAQYEVAKDYLKDYRDAITTVEEVLKTVDIETRPTIRENIAKVCECIDTLYSLCAKEGYSKKTTAAIVKGAFPSLTKNERSKARYYAQNAYDIQAYLLLIESAAISVDRMCRIYTDSLKKADKKRKSDSVLHRQFKTEGVPVRVLYGHEQSEPVEPIKFNKDITIDDLYNLVGQSVFALHGRRSELTFDMLARSVETLENVINDLKSEMSTRKTLKVVNQ